MTEPTYTQAGARFVRETAPTDGAVRRVRERIDRQVGLDGSVAAEVGDVPGPAPGAEARVARRVRRSVRDRRGRRWSPGVFGVGPARPWQPVAALAVAALVVLSLRSAPEPPPPALEVVDAPPPRAPEPALAPPEEPLDEPLGDAATDAPSPSPAPEALPTLPSPAAATPPQAPPDRVASLDAVGESELTSFGGWTSGTPDPRVRLRYRGEGTLHAGGDDFELRWTDGRVEVDVDPGAGVRLTVVTAEARVAIVGTVFGVQSGPDGTRVDVREGTVSVRCHGEREQRLTAGEEATCAPVEPRRLVLRGVRMYGDAPCEDVLTALDAGLDRWPKDGPELTFGMALWHRVLCLDELGRRTEARSAAEQYVDLGLTGNRADALEYLARRR